LRNHFKEALGSGYVDGIVWDRFLKRMNEIGYLLNKMMKNVRTARDSYEQERKSKRGSSRRLPGLLKLLSEGDTSSPA
jgi:DNA modification methylase